MPARKTINQPTKFVGAVTPLERVRDVNFGKRLKGIIADKNMTASDVAAKIWDRHRNSKGALVAKGRDRLSVWINGKAFPDHDNLVKLARALDVKVSDLAPDAETKAANRMTPKWSMVGSDEYPAGQTFLQIAQFVSVKTALEIMALLEADATGVKLETNEG
jgi:transcriptional regulator with XRE-family HTH domain